MKLTAHSLFCTDLTERNPGPSTRTGDPLNDGLHVRVVRNKRKKRARSSAICAWLRLIRFFRIH